MLRALILENFKAFGGRRVIPIRPLTLIFGPNSAGKSAILQSLLLLKQTLTDPETGDVPLRLKGSLVDLGTFRDMVYRHDMDRICEITPLLEFDPEVGDRFPTQLSIRRATDGLDESFGMGLRVSLAGRPTRMVVDSLPLYLGDTAEPVCAMVKRLDRVRELVGMYGLDGPFVEPEEDDSEPFVAPKVKRNHSLWRDLYAAFSHEDLPRIIDLIEDDITHGTRFEAFYLHMDRIDIRWNEEFAGGELEKYRMYNFGRYCFDLEFDSTVRWTILRKFLIADAANLASITNPGRSVNRVQLAPASYYEDRRNLLRYLLDEGESGRMPNLADLALEMSAGIQWVLERLVYVGPLREFPERHYLFGGAVPADVGRSGRFAADILFNRPDLLERTNEALTHFDIGYRLDVRRFRDEMGGESSVFSLGLVDVRSNVQVNLRDVGFGVSQVLPVLVQSMLAENQIILTEQPELHLHPRLQAELGDVFIRSALGGDRNTFLLETHSEHLILRIMRRLRDTSMGTLPDGIPPVRPEDVSVIYVQPTKDGSIPLVMDLDEEGQLLTAWPNGFFEEGFHERFA